MTLFDQYAYPPNELGYCGPTDGGGAFGLAAHAKEFDGAWPYLAAIAEALGASDPLDEEVVSSYWVGGPALAKVDPAALLTRLRTSFTGQVTGLLDAVVPGPDVLAHHSFHVFVVYPWVRFLDRDAATALGVMQDCRIRWGTVESIDGEHAVITSPPLGLAGGELILGDPRPERVQWKKGELSLAPAPSPGSIVAVHWNWVCEQLEADQRTALEAATQSTLDMVNTLRGGRQ
ncbi:hypothetical protein GGC64_000585 [Mycobacterium sp. OAS707]|uniref:DUF6390 family protein n=1 Tax=Mycobacterium sp. OAS707 TaxID=2663822 RepID=UPI00178BA000|nr:DUF6390 family protein [Mycobacterium sp. OAS707]MBE1546577.1 hypothetical protein [Mycobacterium sp. OAS707]